MLFAALVFATMAGAVFSDIDVGDWFSVDLGNVYSAIGADSPIGVLVAALVLLVVGLIASIAAVALRFLKFKWAWAVSLGACLLLVVAGILYFCPATGNYKDLGLGVGSVLSAIFCLISGLSAGAAGVLDVLKK